VSTAGLPNEEQGLATGLTSMTQLAAVTIGIPILSGVISLRQDALEGIQWALTFDVVVTLVSVLLIGWGLRSRREKPASLTR